MVQNPMKSGNGTKGFLTGMFNISIGYFISKLFYIVDLDRDQN